MNYAKRIHLLGTENAFSLGPIIEKIESSGSKIIRLHLGEPDFSIPHCLKTEIEHQLQLDNTHYCDPQGVLVLREAISERIALTRNISISPDQVVIFPGAKPGIGFSQQLYCNPGDEVIYPSPGFPIMESFIRYLQLKPVPLLLEEAHQFLPTAKQLKRCISSKTKLIFLNFPGNPTGARASYEQLQELAEVILKYCPPHVRVYSDEIYDRIIFGLTPHFSIASVPGMQDKTLISGGFSKAYAWTGGRVGYLICPSVEEALLFKQLNINYFSCVPPYHQVAASHMLTNPEAEDQVNKMVNTFEKRALYVYHELQKIPDLTCIPSQGAFYLFPNVEKICENLGIIDYYKSLPSSRTKTTSPSTLFQQFLLHYHHLAVLDRRSFGVLGSQTQHCVRISYVSDMAALEEGLFRFQLACQDRDGFKQFSQRNMT